MLQTSNTTGKYGFSISSDTSPTPISIVPTNWPRHESERSFFLKHDTADSVICTDSLAERINEAFAQLDDPGQHTTYANVEDFLTSLRNRRENH